MLTFTYGWAFWLLPLPLAIWWLWPPRRQPRLAVRVPFLSRLRTAGVESGKDAHRGTYRALGFRLWVWVLVVVALARPQWLEPPIERTVPTRDLLLIVDLSGSMEQEDFTDAEGMAVDRLTAVKEVLREFLAGREGDRVGLVVFGNAPFLQVPFTPDLLLCQRLLDETAVRMAGPRTALGDAIGFGIQLFEQSDVPTKTIIALTDGNDTGSGVPPIEAARVAADREITVYTVAIGDPATVGEERLDEETLRAVAEVTGGSFFLGMNRDELAGIYRQLDAIETREIKSVSHRPRRDLYFWPLALAVVCALGVQVWVVLMRDGGIAPAASRARVRVNPRTFELEVRES